MIGHISLQKNSIFLIFIGKALLIALPPSTRLGLVVNQSASASKGDLRKCKNFFGAALGPISCVARLSAFVQVDTSAKNLYF